MNDSVFKDFLLVLFALLTVPMPMMGQESNGAAAGSSLDMQVDSTIKVTQLKDAVIVSSINPVKVIADTLEYNPMAYRLAEDAMLEDVLRRLPGIEVNGDEVTFYGKPVKQLLIDGERFFAGDVKAGLQNISADMISKVRAYERESDFTRITGIDDGDSEAVLDLKVRKSMMGGWNGNVTGGYGQHGRYNARVNASRVQKGRQASLVANFNNVNGAININNASRTQLGGGSSGDVHKRELGFSLSRKAKKLNADLTLHYSGNTRDVVSERVMERAYSDGIITTLSNSQGLNRNNVPKFDARIEWKPGKNITLLCRPSFKYTGNRNSSHTTGDNFGLNEELKSSMDNHHFQHQDNYTASIYLQLALRNVNARKGRSISFSLSPQYTGVFESNPQSYRTVYPSTKTKDRKILMDSRNGSFSVGGQIAYSEPLGRHLYLQTIVYSQLVAKSSDRRVYDLMAAAGAWNFGDDLPWNYRFFQIEDISAQGRYLLSNNRLTLNLRYSTKKFNVTGGVSFSPQFSRLEYRDTVGHDSVVRNHAFFAAPYLNMVWHPGRNDRLALTYNATASSPSMYALMPVSSGTNPLYVHHGNENLLPAYTHKTEFNYNTGNAARGSSLVTNITARILQNQTSNLVEYDPQTGGTITIPYNINGNWDLKGTMAYNKTFGKGFSLVQHASVDYTHTNSFLYDSHTRTSAVNALRRAMAKESLDFQWRCSWLEVTGNINADITSETCSMRPEMNQLPYTIGAGLKSTLICPWGTRFKADWSFMHQSGFTMAELNRNYNVLNLSLSHPFAGRRFIVSVESFDLLGQLPNLTRVFSQTSRSVTMFNGYNRYVILRAVYKFRSKDHCLLKLR